MSSLGGTIPCRGKQSLGKRFAHRCGSPWRRELLGCNSFLCRLPRVLSCAPLATSRGARMLKAKANAILYTIATYALHRRPCETIPPSLSTGPAASAGFGGDHVREHVRRTPCAGRRPWASRYQPSTAVNRVRLAEHRLSRSSARSSADSCQTHLSCQGVHPPGLAATAQPQARPLRQQAPLG